ncbi:MAG: hypothetical protein KDC45_01715 [Bacteroidetes bacterium]|nr:hypothetical protein [Bacteroidota bacterium]
MKYLVQLLIPILVTTSAIAQSEPDYESVYRSGEEKIKSQWGMNVQISSVGFVIGGMYNYKVAPKTFLTSSLDMFWVRGKDEQQTYDYYTGQIITINSETILMLPLQVLVKRRILTDVLSSSMRPFISGGAGAVAAWYLDGDAPKSFLRDSIDHKASQLTWTATVGFGADFGKPGSTGYGVDFRYQVLGFPHYLGLRKRFDNFQIGFHMNF